MDDYNDYRCSALVSYVADDAGIYILGTPFMRNFYISFDYNDQTMTFTSKWTISDAAKDYGGMSGMSVLIVLVGICVLLIYIGVMIYCCCKNKKKQKEEALEESEIKAEGYEAAEF